MEPSSHRLGSVPPRGVLDARAKVVLLLVYSVTLFLVGSWAGLAMAAALLLVAGTWLRAPWRSVLAMGGVAYALIATVVLLNALQGPDGALRGLFLAGRLVLLLWASFAMVLTTGDVELQGALASLLSPLRALRVPVDDIALTLSLALRFIPDIADQIKVVRRAQASRGGWMPGASLTKALSLWSRTFSAVLVRLFRRADRVAVALEARCYGLGGEEGPARTSLRDDRLGAADAAALAAGCLACVALALFA